MDQNLKQRLVGAGVLIGLGVVIIPLLLGEPAGFSSSKERISDLESPTQAVSRLESEGSPPGQGAGVLSTPAADRELSSAPVLAKAAEANSRRPRPPASAEPVQEKGGWVVQIGSFSQQDNARRMHDRAASLGYRVFIESSHEGAKKIYRVRVGPEQDPGRARELKQELEHRLQVSAFLISPPEI